MANKDKAEPKFLGPEGMGPGPTRARACPPRQHWDVALKKCVRVQPKTAMGRPPRPRSKSDPRHPMRKQRRKQLGASFGEYMSTKE